MTADQFNRILANARRGRNTLANPAGFIIAKIRELNARV